MNRYHCFSVGGRHLLHLPRSGRLFELEAPAMEALRQSGERLDSPAPADGEDPLSELADLLAEEPTEPVLDPDRGAEAVPPSRRFSIYVAGSCNLSCHYCWNDRGTFGRKASIMGRPAAERVVERISEVFAEDGPCSVAFYGGEPLLNFEIIRFVTLALVARAAPLRRPIRFTVDTNGTLLDADKIAFLAQHFAQVGISLDGDQAIHDRNRPFLAGGGSWGAVVSKLDRFPDRSKLLLRATLTQSSPSYLDTFRWLCALGAGGVQVAYAHDLETNPAACAPQLIVPLDRQRAEKVEFADWWIGELARHPVGEVPRYLDGLLADLRAFAHAQRSVRPCGAGLHLRAFDPDGREVPCILFAGIETLPEPAVAEPVPFPSWNAETTEPCRSCWARYDCSGGCFATNLQMTGDLFRPHPQECAEAMSNLEVRLYTLALAKTICPQHLAGAAGRG